MRRTLIAALLAVAMLGVIGLGPITPPATQAAIVPDTARIFGENRFLTAVEVSKRSFPDGAPAVVLATGRGFADALAGGPAAFLLGGPILLVEPDRLPDGVGPELTRLQPDRIVLLGGTNAVNEATATQVQQATGVAPERIAGATRYETAAAVAQLFGPGDGPAYVATGANFPDALAGSAAAAIRGGPMLLVAPDGTPAATAAQLDRLNPTEIVVLGGTTAVSDVIANGLGGFGPVRRIAGPERYATAALIAQDAFPNAQGVTLATGEGFADALTAGPAAARAAAPVLLSPPSCATPGILDFLRARGWPGMVVIGGIAALGPRAAALWPCAPPTDGPVAPGISFARIALPGPVVAHLLVVDRNQVRVESHLAAEDGSLRDKVPMTTMARREGAVAAINGDYFTPDGRPVHLFASNGKLLLSPGLIENVYALDSRRTNVGYLGTPAPVQTLELPDQAPVPIARTNDGDLAAGEIGMYTPEGEGNPAPPAVACSVLLAPSGAPAVNAGGATAQAHSVVADGACGSTPAAVPAGQVRLATPAGGAYASLIDGLTAGATVTTTWMLHPTWPGVVDATGGNPLLVVNGGLTDEMANATGGPYSERAPRTGVGFTADGRMLLLEVDGRQPGYSRGMTYREFAQAFVNLGAVSALNLDGGGSSSVVINGVLANRPSDATGERPVGTGILLFSGPPQPVASTFSENQIDSANVELPMELDSASIGGYASERLRRGDPVTPIILDIAEAYDRAHQGHGDGG